MKKIAVTALITALLGCSPQSSDDPRDRQGQPGATTWRIVADAQGQAAFLSKPGAAPDLVLWCRGDGLVTLRAHVFENPVSPPSLVLRSPTGEIVFQNVRNQGGMRAADRKLVEGQTDVSDKAVVSVMSALDQVDVRNGAQVWAVKGTDPQAVMPAFATACQTR